MVGVELVSPLLVWPCFSIASARSTGRRRGLRAIALGGLATVMGVALSLNGAALSAASEPPPRWYVNGQLAVGQVPVKLHGTIGQYVTGAEILVSCRVSGRGFIVNPG